MFLYSLVVKHNSPSAKLHYFLGLQYAKFNKNSPKNYIFHALDLSKNVSYASQRACNKRFAWCIIDFLLDWVYSRKFA